MEIEFVSGKTICALQLQKDVYNLPSHDALAQILPDYRSLLSRARTELQMHHPHRRYGAHIQTRNMHLLPMNSHQTEVANYRSAMTRMADDMITLRTQVGTLEAENSQLRSDLRLHQDLGRDLLADTDVDVMTKAEIADRIATLKVKLASETSKTASQRDKIQQLQNELIRKNDSEKELLKLQKVQQEDLQNHQTHLAKMATLEVTVKQQEKVIEKMEKALDSKLKEKRRQNEADRKKEESALAAENLRLRKELDRIRQPPAPVIIQQSAQVLLKNSHENAQLQVKVKSSDTQKSSLEENAKLWGRQKQEMLTKLSEHKHGFVRTATTILHNVPSPPHGLATPSLQSSSTE
uniref:Coiled-coil domain containing 33 n=1 Tax=Stegastes partitus TaxID=144197 RepID=A0A3B5BE42_9TELE